MNKNETNQWIANYRTDQPHFGLERMVELLALRGNPHLKLKVIHIGGTNGKGSTIAFLKNMLEKMGLRVVEAKDGIEGLARMQDLYEMYGDKLSQFLRVILSDIEMPQMDGYRFASTLKNNPRYAGIPIIFNSSISNDYSEAQSKEAGAAAYLTKFDASLFYNEVLRVIEANKK